MLNYKYGFELECFYLDNGKITLPPVDYPHDGMAGLVEIRTEGYASLEDAYYNLLKLCNKCRISPVSFDNLAFDPEYSFTANQRRELRKRIPQTKIPCDIQNIYNKKPRALGNKTIASLQINISNLVQRDYEETYYTTEGKERKKNIPAKFGLFDVPKIVKALDEEFIREIRHTHRQPGEYCIKGDRLEYRSLPNTVAAFDVKGINNLLSRIKKCVEE